MTSSTNQTRRSVGWMGLKRGHQAHPVEWLAEQAIFLISLSAILMVFLIFVFVAREAWPVLRGQANSSLVRPVIPVEQMDQLSPQKLQDYLGLTPKQYAQMDQETLKSLMEVKIEAAKEVPDDKDARLNTVGWRYLTRPYQWTGYDQPVSIWQPVSPVPKFNIVPLIIGSLKATLVALAFGVPLALGAAVYVSQLAAPRYREWLKPGIELLAGIPSVVLGFFALIVLASFFQGLFGYQSRLNAFVAGIALGLAIIPVVFSIAEDALTSVPRSYTHPLWGKPAILWASLTLAVMTLPVMIVATEESLRAIPQGLREGSLALGATKLQTILRVVLPQALPGMLTGSILAISWAAGEVAPILFTGAAYYMAQLPSSLTDQFMDLGYHVFVLSTQSPNIEQTRPILYATVFVLLLLTFALNVVAILIRARIRAKMRAVS